VNPPGASQLGHPLRLVESEDVTAELPADPFGELTFAAADLEYASQFDLTNRLEGHLARVRAFGEAVGGLALGEPGLARVFLSD
jgi:hypothetical protein